MSLSFELGILANFKHEGIITEEEFSLKKSQLLNRDHNNQSIIGTNDLSQNQTIISEQSALAKEPVPDAVPLQSSKFRIVTQPLFQNWKLIGIIFGSIVLIAILLKVSGLFPLPSIIGDKYLAQPDNDHKQSETKAIPKEDVRNLIDQWLTSWKSGDIKTYRSCYAPDFQSKEKNLNAWISYKANVQKKSKKINISIDKLQISVKGNKATAVFTQSYSSSILKDSGKKKLELRKINDEWKIYKESM